MQTVTPAYGRDYKSAAAAIVDWKSGKDFLAQPQGQYCSIQDFPDSAVTIRYAQMRKVTVYRPTKGAR